MKKRLPRIPPRVYAPAVILGLIAFFWLLSPRPGAGPAAGSRAPAFRLIDLSGRTADLAEYHGKVVLLDFWATWCGDCEAETPALKSLHEKYQGRGFALLGASVDEGPPEAVARFVAEHRLSYRIVFADEEAVQDYRIFGLPTKFLIDAEGVIYRKYLTDTPATELEADIIALLKRRDS
ncbi:MAG: TlpA disulfide reductase family protein [Elusimicrobiota bacterium]